MTVPKKASEKTGPSGNKTADADARTDAMLVQRVQDGDRRAFDELVRRHRDRIFNLCYWSLNDYQEADDTAQDVFIKLFQSIDTFRQDAAFSTWLYRIAVNTCKNKQKSLYFRLLKKRKSIDQPDIGGRIREPDDPAASPGRQLDAKESAETIHRAIQTLAKKKRTVLLLRDIEGMTYDEIAEITGLKMGTVRSTLARARDELKQKLTRISHEFYGVNMGVK